MTGHKERETARAFMTARVRDHNVACRRSINPFDLDAFVGVIRMTIPRSRNHVASSLELNSPPWSEWNMPTFAPNIFSRCTIRHCNSYAAALLIFSDMRLYLVAPSLTVKRHRDFSNLSTPGKLKSACKHWSGDHSRVPCARGTFLSLPPIHVRQCSVMETSGGIRRPFGAVP
jgi:hypothetical protein